MAQIFKSSQTEVSAHNKVASQAVHSIGGACQPPKAQIRRMQGCFLYPCKSARQNFCRCLCFVTSLLQATCPCPRSRPPPNDAVFLASFLAHLQRWRPIATANGASPKKVICLLIAVISFSYYLIWKLVSLYRLIKDPLIWLALAAVAVAAT